MHLGHRFAAALGAALALASSFAPSDTRACSICQAGDPLYSGFGATPLEASSFSLYLEIQGWRKTSGLLPEDGVVEKGREVNESQILSAYLSWSPLDRLTLTLDAPWRFNAVIEEPEEGRSRSTLSGFGDLSLTASYVVLRNRPVLPTTWVDLRLFGKAPTGQREQTVDGKTDPHLQLGTGSWDWGVGIAGGHRVDWGSFYLSLFYRFNGAGALDYRYGDVALVNLAFDTPLGHVVGVPALDFLTPGVELNFRYAGEDISEGARYQDSGGAIAYVTPTLRIRLPWLEGRRPPSLRLAAQLPFGQTWLQGEQHEGVTWSAGVLLPF
ncbi:MAG TPA: hypothetical protein VMW35_02775 [Myxococcota bacterium]|jgi:hypothetical protein|nr:hypothetical protein [Myxococcota bacterium]